MNEELMVILSKDNRAFETAWFSSMSAARKWADKIRDTILHFCDRFLGRFAPQKEEVNDHNEKS